MPAGIETDSTIGSRGGNVRDLDMARDLQAGQRTKRDWSGAIDEQIRLKLVGTATIHANDIDCLGVPPEHRNLIGTRMARYANKGWMEPTTERRKVEHPAANGRKNPVYRITRKGWQELTAGVCAGLQREFGSRDPINPTPSADPGEQSRPTGTPGEKSPDRSDKPEPVPSASAIRGAGSGVTGHHAPEPASQSHEPLSLLPEVDPEAWAA